MTRTTLVSGTAILALLAFGGGAWLGTRPEPIAEVVAAASTAVEPAAATSATETGAPAPAVEPAMETAQPAIAASADEAPLIRPYSPILGPADAPVTIVEFFDPSCEACRAFHPILQSIREEFPTEVRIVLRYATFHEGSDEAVRILEAARAQGVFEPVLDALLERQPEWALHEGPRLDLAWAIAGEAGLDATAGQAYRQMPGVVAILNGDAADVAAVGIQQTPTFFVDGEPLAEFGPKELTEAVRAAVEAL